MHGVHPGADAAIHLAGDAQQLDAVTEFRGEGDIDRGDAADALDVHRVERHRPAEGERRQDGQLVRRVDAVDVEGGVGLGVAQLLGVGQDFGEFPAAFAHLRQDVVAGAVENAGDALDAVGGQAFADRLDHRDAAGDRGLEGERDVVFLGQGGQGGAVHREHRLVGGDHRPAGGERGFHQGAGGAVGAADQFQHHVHVGVGGQRHRILVPAQAGDGHLAFLGAVAGGHGGDGDGAAGAGGDQVGIVAQQLQHAGADGAQAGDGDGERAGHERRPGLCGAGGTGMAGGFLWRSGPVLRRNIAATGRGCSIGRCFRIECRDGGAPKRRPMTQAAVAKRIRL